MLKLLATSFATGAGVGVGLVLATSLCRSETNPRREFVRRVAADIYARHAISVESAVSQAETLFEEIEDWEEDHV